MKNKDKTIEQFSQETQSLINRARNEWEEIFDTINEDKDLNIIRANKAAEKLLELPFEKILNQKCYFSYHGTDCPPESCPSCKTLKTGRPSTTETFEPKVNKYLEIKAFPRFDDKGQIIGVVHVVNDITHKKRLENQLRNMSITDELSYPRKEKGCNTLY
jgi:transcriptional regulator with PAS, ATPase and Fis domain